MGRMKRKGGSIWCRLFHRARWYGATRITQRGKQRTWECRKCRAWYPRGSVEPIQVIDAAWRDPNVEV